MALQPFAWRDRPALIESVFPVQKVSAESYKEQMANQGKTLTALGSYWKGRKPLILNKACILGALLPATGNPLKDLEIFDLLMGMDKESMRQRMAAKLPAKWAEKAVEALDRPYREQVEMGLRPEEMDAGLFAHVWDTVNAHLGTSAHSFPELVEQMGIARFGHRPKVADVFCGSGQIPFEAARLGCDVYASDLNPIACMLTWGAINIVGASAEAKKKIEASQEDVVNKVSEEIQRLGIETDGQGWTAKAFLYCLETTCPETGWAVPLLPSLVVSQGKVFVVRLMPNASSKRYEFEICRASSDDEIKKAKIGTIQGNDIVHSPDGQTIYRISLKRIRGIQHIGTNAANGLRLWDKSDFIAHPDDVFHERLYCIHWMKKKKKGKTYDYEFRSVTDDDLAREQKVIDYVDTYLAEWQEKGYVPDMHIEKGYNTDQPIRERGWTFWHHLFNPRQLLLNGLLKKYSDKPECYVGLAQALNRSSRLCKWDSTPGVDAVGDVFFNQALNTLYNYGCRSLPYLSNQITLTGCKHYPLSHSSLTVSTCPAQAHQSTHDIYITDPPYGDAVKYEEITEFFIAWLRKNPPKEFADWTWDSRRALAIKGEGEEFRQGMIAAYRRMREHMPDNGIQILMFTHQSGAIWSEMANIIWAAGLRVTAAWYVVTETDSALRQGANVKGTVILVLRKRLGDEKTFRDDLGYEISEAVATQIKLMTGLDEQARGQGAEGLYGDSDYQMAGYAAALKVLTAFSRIDGKDMVAEAAATRRPGVKTFVDELLDFAVQTAVQYLIPRPFPKEYWPKLQPVERFYLKMAEMEARGEKTIDNYQNFSKAFQVRDFGALMSDNTRANAARLKLGMEFRGSLMSGNAEIAGTPLRALLYGVHEITKGVETDEALIHLMENCSGNYLHWRPLLAEMADFLAAKRSGLKPTRNFAPDEEARAARILAEAIRNQRL